MPFSTVSVPAALAAALCLVLPAVASADHPTLPAGGPGPLPAAEVTAGELDPLEVELLGAEHAAEHAAARRAGEEGDENTNLPVWEPNRYTGGAPAAVGRWDPAYLDLPTYAIHAVMLPTGRVLFWGYPPLDQVTGKRPNFGQAGIWDPALGTGPASIREVPPPVIDVDGDGNYEAAPVYCSGQSFLPDGRVLIAGGNLIWANKSDEDGYTIDSGTKTVFIFDPWTETWERQPDMTDGRWYPTQTQLPDGRTLILGGWTEEEPGGVYSQTAEFFTPAGGGQPAKLEMHPGANRETDLYPHLFLMPGGDVAQVGPGKFTSAVYRTGQDQWTSLPPSSDTRTGGTAVLLPDGPGGGSELWQIGGYSAVTKRALASVEQIHPLAEEPEWTFGSELNVNRSYHNTVQLPDGSMVTVGGGSGFSQTAGNYLNGPGAEERRRVELFDPATGSWKLGPSQREDRTYHSTAVLLPDGRIFSAGDDARPYEEDSFGRFATSDTAEIYSPPYLFRAGARPAILKTPRTVSYGDTFGVRTRKGKGKHVALVAPSAVTHAADMNQRVIPLEAAGHARKRGLNVVAPPAPDVALPGHYMLFVMRNNGKPSVARWIVLDESAPDRRKLKPMKKRKPSRKRAKKHR